MPQYTRVHRLLKLLTLIQSGQGWTAAKLAAECGVTERTIFRDLNELAGVGISVVFDDAARTYRVQGDFFLPPVHFTPEEALAMAVLCEHIARPEQIAFTKPAWKALAKVFASLPGSIREDVYRKSQRVAVRTAKASPADGFVDLYETIQTAIAGTRALVCTYDSLSGQTDGQEFDFEPYMLFFSVRAWYAIGYHAGRRDVRVLKLNRFGSMRLTDRTYRIPEDFSLDSHLGNAWRMIRGEPDHQVEIHFEPEFAETMSETHWHKTQDVEFHTDGSATFRCTVSGLDEIVWWVLSMGPHCTVRKPRELRERVCRAASEMLERYAHA
ncbi:MAG: helix-turn-helix transcriptional regulator [Phycisphaerales bacterium JB040]